MKKYFCSFRMGMKSEYEYRLNFIFVLFSAFFPMIIQTFLWIAIFENSKKPIVYGYTLNQMILYTILSQMIAKFLKTGVETEISTDVKTGGLSKYIIKPFNYLLYKLFGFVGKKAIHMEIILVFILIVLVVFNWKVQITMSIGRGVVFLVAVFLALILSFYIFCCLSMLSFWVTDAWGIFFGARFLIDMMSGAIFPIDIFGETIIKVFQALPFQYMVYFTVNIITGKISLHMALQGIGIQVIWILVLGLLTRYLWKRGLLQYVAVGG